MKHDSQRHKLHVLARRASEGSAGNEDPSLHVLARRASEGSAGNEDPSLARRANIDELLAHGGALEMAADGTCRRRASVPGQVLMPGSFHPVHEGHWKLAQTGQSLLGRPVAFELSLANVDKPDLTWDEVRRRAEPFLGMETLWITRAPTFVQKSELFPQAVFVIGADTALRILQARYYAPGQGSVEKALAQLRERGCRFLIGCRVDGSQRVVRRQDLQIPMGFDDLFQEISPTDFRVDLSSTEIRRKNTATGDELLRK